LGENVDLFCREPRSYEWATDKAERANVHLAEDLVFGLDVESVLDEEQGVLALLSEIGSTLYGSLQTRYFELDSRHHALPLRVALNQGRKAGWQLSTSLSRGGALNALREDRERTEGSVPPSNVDLSQVFAYGTDSPTVAGQATRALLSYLNKFDHITTNRLHLCIPGALLGKQVDFYANSYFKNRAVYEHSIRGRFPNVRWCGSWTSPD
jgi:exopolysaccharide biosynthesis predicted pyruvyltransferase EpsI